MKTKLARMFAKSRQKRPELWVAKAKKWREIDETVALEPAPKAAGWVVLMVEPRMEEKASTALREAGYVAWFPQTVEVVKNDFRKIRRMVNRPLFARYVFAASLGRIGMGDCDHVSAIIGDVSQALVDNLSIRQGCGEFIATEPAKVFGKGSRVRITDGPFSGLDGIVNRPAKDRVEVLVTLFGRETPVNLEHGQVEAA